MRSLYYLKKVSGADLGVCAEAAAAPPFQFVRDFFFVKIYNNFIIL